MGKLTKDATKKTPKNAGHEIKRNLTLTFKTSLENAKEIGIFYCHPKPSNFSIYVTSGREH